MNNENLRTYLRYTSAVILVAGLFSALLIYVTSDDHPGSDLGYEQAGGSAYPVLPEDSKQYLRGLELYGGTANVLADELRRWFSGLWHGKSLAFTVAFFSILISSVLLYAANRLQYRFTKDVRENKTLRRRGDKE